MLDNPEKTAKFTQEQINQRRKELGIDGSIDDYVPVAERGSRIKLIVGPTSEPPLSSSSSSSIADDERINLEKIGKRSRDFFQLFQGLDVNAALEKACRLHLVPCIVQLDDKTIAATKRIRYDRVLLAFEDGFVSDAYVG